VTLLQQKNPGESRGFLLAGGRFDWDGFAAQAAFA